MDLADVTLDTMKPYVGTTFEVALPDGSTTTLRLDEVLPFETRQRRQRLQPKREPFSLYLLGDPSLLLPQGTYSLRSESLSFEEIFLVPIGKDEKATEYEAIFT